MLRYLRRLALRWLALAAFALGWAVLTRWAFALAVLPWGLSALVAWRTARLSLRGVAAATIVAVVVGGLVLGSQFVFDAGQEEVAYTGDLQVYSWNPANALKRTGSNVDGVFHYERPMGLYYALPIIHPAYVFPAFFPFLLLGLLPARFRVTASDILPLKRLQATIKTKLAEAVQLWHREEPAVLVLLITWPLVVYAFLAGVTWQNARFALTFFPPLLVLVALGLEWTWQQIKPAWRPLLVGWCVLGLLGSLAWAARDLRNFLTNVKQTPLATVQWAEAQVEPEATVVTFSVTLTMNHYTTLNALDVYELDETDLVALLQNESPFYLLLDLANIESQWQDKSPQLNYQWLRERADLVEIGRFNNYTLFEVKRRLEIGD